MTLTIDLKPELEARLKDEASRAGTDAGEYVVRTLEQCLLESQPDGVSATPESDLLQEINKGLPEETWEQYHALISKRRDETLTRDEQALLIQISDRLEALNCRRISALAELARRRGVPLPQVMNDLGIKTPPPYS